MKPFDTLTESGQTRRLRKLALQALSAWSLDVAQVSLIAVHTNTLFRVVEHDRTKYALRICEPDEHSDASALCEVTWLAALGDNTDLPIPKLIRTTTGDPWVYAEADGVPEARRCMLFSWIPGQAVGGHETAAIYGQMGAFMAKMHNFAEQFTLPADFRPMSWDSTFYWPDEPVVIDDPAYSHLITPERRAILAKIIPEIDATLSDLFAQSNPPIVLHGDFHADNVHRFRGQLYALDFADLLLGHPVQDIAITMYDSRFADDFSALRSAFKTGYESVRPWPVQSERQLSLLMAGRMVSFVNYVSHSFNGNSAEKYISGWFKELQHLLNNNFQ